MGDPLALRRGIPLLELLAYFGCCGFLIDLLLCVILVLKVQEYLKLSLKHGRVDKAVG